jgi:20S proteasome alpha/beta subunit
LLRLKYKKPVRPANKMTYILGSRCKDGVVLVADTRFTVDDGTRYDHDDKLIREFPDLLSIIIGFSGSKEPFTDFRMRLRDRTSELKREYLEKK